MALASRPSCASETGGKSERERLSALHARLVAVIRARWREAEAEDIAQEAFLRLSLAESRAEVLDPAAFLHVTAFNLIRDRIRAEATRATFPVDSGYFAQVVCDDPAPEQILAARDQLAILAAAIAELPPKAGAALILYRLDNLPHARIAEELGISVSMVEKHIRRAQAHCRARLADQGSVRKVR